MTSLVENAYILDATEDPPSVPKPSHCGAPNIKISGSESHSPRCRPSAAASALVCRGSGRRRERIMRRGRPHGKHVPLLPSSRVHRIPAAPIQSAVDGRRRQTHSQAGPRRPCVHPGQRPRAARLPRLPRRLSPFRRSLHLPALPRRLPRSLHVHHRSAKASELLAQRDVMNYEDFPKASK